MSSTQSKCYKGNIMAMTYGQCQCNIESKTCERNSSSFWWIELCSVKDDKQTLFHSASWWWQTARVASAWRTILRYCWRNLVPMEEVVRFWGDISNMARRNWCKLTEHQCHKVPCSNYGPSLPAVPGCSGLPRSSSLHFVGQQLHTPRSATGYGIHNSINMTNMLPWPTKAPDFKIIECLKSSEAPI